MSIFKWKVYCTDEDEYMTGFLEESEGNPTVCFNNNTHSIDSTLTKKLEIISDNYTGQLTKWKVFCDTEQIYTYGYSDEYTYPERCFNNVNHVVSKHPIELKRIRNSNISADITEEHVTDEPTGGNFRTDGFEIVATANTITHKDFSWPYPIAALILRFTTEETHRGDYINCFGKPVANLNNLSSAITSSTSVLPVNSTTLFQVGMCISITDSVNTENLGRITSIDTENSTITTQNSTTFSYLKHAYIGYHTPLGTITSSVTAGDFEITCSNTVINNVTRGMIFYIDDGTNMESLGEIFEIDTSTNKVIIQIPPTNSYSSGTLVKVAFHMIKKYKIGPPSEHTIGAGKIGGFYLNKFYVIDIEYDNKSVATNKNFNWYTEVLY